MTYTERMITILTAANDVLTREGLREVGEAEHFLEVIDRLVRAYRQATRGPALPGIDLYWERES